MCYWKFCRSCSGLPSCLLVFKHIVSLSVALALSPRLDLNGGNLGIVGRTEVSSVCPCPLIEFNYYP